jgi:hypothetical protein
MRPLLLGLLLITLPALAAQPATDGFTSLFNGKDLTGWVPVNVATGTDHDTFTVKDGEIVCTGVPTGVLRSEKMYENFIVELEWRHLRPGGNSGFFVWSDALTAKGVPFTRAVENQILDGPGGDGYTTQGDVFAIHGATMSPGNPGKWKGRSYPTESRTKPSPQWNHYRIECNNGNIALAVNGKVVTTATNVSQRKGYLCLESEGGLIHFRNIRIKQLPPTKNLDPKYIAHQDEGYKSLYTGLDLSGWEFSRPASKLHWHPTDWKLRFERDPLLAEAGDVTDPTLHTTAEYENFSMIIDFKSDHPIDLHLPSFDRVTLPEPAPVPNPDYKPGTKSYQAIPRPKGVWRRAQINLTADMLMITGDDFDPVTLPRKAAAAPRKAPIGLCPTGPADFANLYLKKPE